MTTINLVADQQDDALAAAAQFALLDKESIEIVGAKGLATNATAALVGGWMGGGMSGGGGGGGVISNEFGVFNIIDTSGMRQDGTDHAKNRARGRFVMAGIVTTDKAST